jgi:hypothetical protein
MNPAAQNVCDYSGQASAFSSPAAGPSRKKILPYN